MSQKAQAHQLNIPVGHLVIDLYVEPINEGDLWLDFISLTWHKVPDDFWGLTLHTDQACVVVRLYR